MVGLDFENLDVKAGAFMESNKVKSTKYKVSLISRKF